MKACPKCGCDEFIVTSHVVQEWKVDGEGNFIECTDDCVEVTHSSDNDDVWSCANCGHNAPGKDFEIK